MKKFNDEVHESLQLVKQKEEELRRLKAQVELAAFELTCAKDLARKSLIRLKKAMNTYVISSPIKTQESEN